MCGVPPRCIQLSSLSNTARPHVLGPRQERASASPCCGHCAWSIWWTANEIGALFEQESDGFTRASLTSRAQGSPSRCERAWPAECVSREEEELNVWYLICRATTLLDQFSPVLWAFERQPEKMRLPSVGRPFQSRTHSGEFYASTTPLGFSVAFHTVREKSCDSANVSFAAGSSRVGLFLFRRSVLSSCSKRLRVLQAFFVGLDPTGGGTVQRSTCTERPKVGFRALYPKARQLAVCTVINKGHLRKFTRHLPPAASSHSRSRCNDVKLGRWYGTGYVSSSGQVHRKKERSDGLHGFWCNGEEWDEAGAVGATTEEWLVHIDGLQLSFLVEIFGQCEQRCFCVEFITSCNAEKWRSVCTWLGDVIDCNGSD